MFELMLVNSWLFSISIESIVKKNSFFHLHILYQILRFFKFSKTHLISTCWNDQSIEVSIYLFFSHVKTDWYTSRLIFARPYWELANIMHRLIIKQKYILFFKTIFFHSSYFHSFHISYFLQDYVDYRTSK